MASSSATRRRQRQLCGGGVGAQVRQFARARDGDQLRVLVQQPRQRHLGVAAPTRGGKPAQRIHQALIGLCRLGLKTRVVPAKIILGQVLHLKIIGQKRPPQGLYATRLTPARRNTAITRPRHRAATANTRSAPPPPDAPPPPAARWLRRLQTNQSAPPCRPAPTRHRPDHVFNRHGRVAAMAVIQPNALHPQTLQRRLTRRADIARTVVDAPAILPGWRTMPNLVATTTCSRALAASPRKNARARLRYGHDHTCRRCRTSSPQGLRLVQHRQRHLIITGPIKLTHAHTTQANGGYRQLRRAEKTCLHIDHFQQKTAARRGKPASRMRISCGGGRRQAWMTRKRLFNAEPIVLSRRSPRVARRASQEVGGRPPRLSGGAADAPFRGGPDFREAQGTRRRRRRRGARVAFFPLSLARQRGRCRGPAQYSAQPTRASAASSQSRHRKPPSTVTPAHSHNWPPPTTKRHQTRHLFRLSWPPGWRCLQNAPGFPPRQTHLRHRRHNRPRIHRIDAHPMGKILQRRTARQPQHRMLAGGVNRAIGKPHLRHHRRRVDNRPPPWARNTGICAFIAQNIACTLASITSAKSAVLKVCRGRRGPARRHC